MTASRRRIFLSQAAALSGGLLSAPAWPVSNANTGHQAGKTGQSLKIICIEEHINEPAIIEASLPHVQAHAPYLTDWGKDVDDNGNLVEPDRPRVIKARDANRKLSEYGSARLKEMDEHGIDIQVLSCAGAPQSVSSQRGIDLIRRHNDRLAAIADRHPGRFAGFASLPWQDAEAAAREAQRCARVLGLNGFLINGRPGAHFLDHARYIPVLAAIDELGLPLFVHPGIVEQPVQRVYYAGFNREVTARLSMFAWGWHHEAGVQVIRMILAGVLDRFRNLQLISGHWGEMVPYYLQRLDDAIPREASGLSRTITQIYREQVHVSPSGMLSLPHFEFTRSTLGVDRILYSVDYPYLSLNGARAFIEKLPFSQEDKEKIAFRNAAKLLKIDL